ALVFVSEPVSVQIRLGSVARFSCSVSRSVKTISWELNQRALPQNSDRITVLPNGVLQIHNVTARDAGKYRCSVENSFGRVKSQEAELSLTTALGRRPILKPQILAGPQNISVAYLQPVVLECLAEGSPRPLVSWSRADSKPIDVSGSRILGNGNLMILAAKAQHSGAYVCRATTPGTRNFTTASGHLNVLVHPSLVEKPESQTRPRAGTARFSCQAEGNPAPNISWFRNGEVIRSNGRTKMYNSKLVITQIIPEDDAFYQCQAENSQGSVIFTSRLIVVLSEDRPSAPRNVHAETISSSAILLAWERPQYNTDKVIAYSIHYMKSDGLNNEEYQAVIGNDTTSHIVDDLDPARNYTFYIVAYMPMGASRMSEQVTQHTLEDVPLRNPELSLVSRSPTDILVSWQPLPPKLSRGRLSAYRLSHRTSSEEQISSVDLPVLWENSTQYLLQGLKPDTIYLIRISASTRVGWSQPSAWSSHRTPKTSSASDRLERSLYDPKLSRPKWQQGLEVTELQTQSGNKATEASVRLLGLFPPSVPPAPNLELEPLNCTSVILRWFPNPSDSSIQGFRLNFYPDAGESESEPEDSITQLPPHERQLTITSLNPRVKYHVKLFAFSANGDGYHAHQTVNTPGCPSSPNRRLAALPPPDHVRASVSGSSAVSISWARPAFSAGKPVSFSVRYSPAGSSDTSSVRYLQTSEQNVTLTGLQSNTRYEFAVRLHMDQISTPLSPPRSVKVTLIEEGTALVSWSPPLQPNLTVTHYTLMFTPQGSRLGQWQILQRE
ncbi:hypothetical protein DNTS_028394, partial [Danionella cerebrum]